jgi:hypothetical protein
VRSAYAIPSTARGTDGLVLGSWSSRTCVVATPSPKASAATRYSVTIRPSPQFVLRQFITAAAELIRGAGVADRIGWINLRRRHTILRNCTTPGLDVWPLSVRERRAALSGSAALLLQAGFTPLRRDGASPGSSVIAPAHSREAGEKPRASPSRGTGRRLASSPHPRGEVEARAIPNVAEGLIERVAAAGRPSHEGAER